MTGPSSALASAVVAPHASLVRYDNPVLVATTKDGRHALGGAAAEKAKRRAEEKQHLTPTEDILNSILPPRSGKRGIDSAGG